MPVVTLLPQIGAVVAVADDPHTTTLAFLLTAALNGPLLVAGRADARRIGIGWARPTVALGWAGVCMLIETWTDGQMATASAVAAVASVATAVLVHVVPGAWTTEGWHLAIRRGLGLPVVRPYALATLRRLIPVLLVAAVALFAIAPLAAVLLAAAVLVAVVGEQVLTNAKSPSPDARRPSPRTRRERVSAP